VRAALRDALRAGPLTARELSARVGVPEKQVAGHLEHLGRSLKAAGERLQSSRHAASTAASSSASATG
jgi:predicted ArsR family transcriptional regulator